MSDIVIRAENLSKQYRIGARQEPYGSLRESLMGALKAPFRDRKEEAETIWALKDVSFEIRRGEVVGVIGRNGAGKSTLLKILSRITKPTRGQAVIRGRVGSLLEVGTGFHPELTGRENIYLNGAILGMRRTEIERKFDEIVDFAEIEQFLDTPVKRYSSGMYVRLAFAVAAHLEPEILLVDEVLAVGDAAFQKKCLGKMGEVAEGGRTVIFVSHNLNAISQLCKNAFLLEKGNIKLKGQSDIVSNAYFDNFSETLCANNELFNMKRRPGEGVKVKFQKVSLENKKGVLRVWEPLQIRIWLKGIKEIQSLSVGLSVLRVDGTVLFSVESEDSGQNYFLKRGANMQFSVTIDNPNLAAGKYLIRLGARSGAYILDWLDSVLFFEVRPDKGSLLSAQAHLGMRPKSNWLLLNN